MGFRLRRLRLVVTTPRGPYGVTIPFTDGLVVLRADNTTGKSTCIQSLLFALGLEGMLSPARAVPLPHAMTASLVDERDGVEVPVIESRVLLEIENLRGESLTIQRWAKHKEISPNLISTWNGPALTLPENHYQQQDF